jgi:hypothetical protein
MEVLHDVFFDFEFVDVVGCWLDCDGMVDWCLLEVNLPEASLGVTISLEDDVVVFYDVNVFGIELCNEPLSQNWLMESSALLASAGKIWALHLPIGRDGRPSRAVCIDVMMLPSGSLTLMPFAVGTFLLTQGLSHFKKWPVQPVSAKALLIGE